MILIVSNVKSIVNNVKIIYAQNVMQDLLNFKESVGNMNVKALKNIKIKKVNVLNARRIASIANKRIVLYFFFNNFIYFL